MSDTVRHAFLSSRLALPRRKLDISGNVTIPTTFRNLLYLIVVPDTHLVATVTALQVLRSIEISYLPPADLEVS